MKTFEIQFTSRYYDEKIYSSELVSAKSKTVALKKFAKLFNIKEYKQLLDENFLWENGSWWSKFKCINEVKETICPHCKGKGKIYSGIK